MARLLNRDVLPTGYYAVPFVDRAGPGPWLPVDPALVVAIDPCRWRSGDRCPHSRYGSPPT